jgi:hypothetical protein
MSNAYPADLRRAARRLWLTGRYTDEAIAAELGIQRSDTIRDWRHQEGWAELGRDVNAVVEEQVAARVRAEHGAFRSKYDQLGQVIENLAVRGLREAGLSHRDLKATAGTIEIAQRIRERALRKDDDEASDKVRSTIAELIKENRARRTGRSGQMPATTAYPDSLSAPPAAGDAGGSAGVD